MSIRSVISVCSHHAFERREEKTDPRKPHVKYVAAVKFKHVSFVFSFLVYFVIFSVPQRDAHTYRSHMRWALSRFHAQTNTRSPHCWCGFYCRLVRTRQRITRTLCLHEDSVARRAEPHWRAFRLTCGTADVANDAAYSNSNAAPVRRYTISIQSVIRLKVVRLFGFTEFHSLVFFVAIYRNSLRIEAKEEKKSRNGKNKIVNDSRTAYRNRMKFQIVLNGLKLIYGDHRSIEKLCYSERKSTRWAKLRRQSNQNRLCVSSSTYFVLLSLLD